MNELTLTLPPATRAARKPGEPWRFVAATTGRKADGIDLQIDVGAVDLDRFRANPVIMVNHNYEKLPVGKAVNIIVEQGRLLLDVVFNTASVVGAEIEQMVRDGFLSAMSVGFEVLKSIGGRATRWRLNEASIVGLPMDAAALVQRSAGQSPIDILCQAVALQLEQEAQARRAELNRLALRVSLLQLRSQQAPPQHRSQLEVIDGALRSILAAQRP